MEVRGPRWRGPSDLALDAAILLVALTMIIAAWPAARRGESCAHPVETAAAADFTVEVGCGEGGPIRGPALLLYGRKLDLATASGAAFEALPGIGPARAAAIVALRASRPFRTVDDLERVRGIGARTVARLRPWLRVDPGPGAKPRGPAPVGEAPRPR